MGQLTEETVGLRMVRNVALVRGAGREAGSAMAVGGFAPASELGVLVCWARFLMVLQLDGGRGCDRVLR